MRLFCLVAVLSLVGFAVSAEPTLTITTETATVVDGVQPVLRYRYGGVPFKPYVDLLTTPSGVNILRDAPHDHLHHHALMFAIKVNDANFWEEAGEPGVQRHMGFQGVRCVPAGVSVPTLLRWIGDPANPPVEMTELRDVRYLASAYKGARLYSWQTRLETDAPATLSGGHYHGLGMRFLESMDEGGAFRIEGDADGEVVRGTEKLTPGKWAAYTAKADGKTVTVAMFDHETNVRPVLWFTMLEPFSYLSATLNLHREPLELVGSMRLTYGIATWDGEPTDDEIDAACRAWHDAALESWAPES